MQILRRVGRSAIPAAGVCMAFLLGCTQESILPPEEERKPEPPEPEFVRTDHGYATIRLQQDNPVTNKTDWVDGGTVYIIYPDGTTENPGTVEMKLRGNATLWFPKKSYNLRFPGKQPVLGFQENRRWCLLANWGDRTLLRNDLAFEISRRTGMEWTPGGDFANLYYNGEYQGVYYLCEKIRGSKNRLDIGDEGFLLEQDLYYDEEHCFRTDLLDIPFLLKEPDGEDFNAETYNSLRQYVNTVERLLVAGDESWKEMVDMDSFARYWIAIELTQNWEPNNPKSCYMYMQEGGVLKAGPVWDFDWHTFIPGAEGFLIKDALWYRYMFRDPEFVRLVKGVWREKRASLGDLPAYLDLRAERIRPYAQINADMWPIPDQTDIWEESIADIRACYKARFSWFDQAVGTIEAVSGESTAANPSRPAGDAEPSGYKVSVPGAGEVFPDVLQTANCYVLAPWESIQFPAVKGGTNIPVGNVAYVNVLWESLGDTSLPTKGSVVSALGHDASVIKVQAGPREGNAVVAAFSAEGKVLWSWHIWVTAEDLEEAAQTYAYGAGIVMDRNLGALSATPGESGSVGLMYQWGRKDPFPGSASVSRAVEPLSTADWPEPVPAGQGGWDQMGTFATEHPMTFIIGAAATRDWYAVSQEGQWGGLWGQDGYKAIADPCPAGWQVAPADLWVQARVINSLGTGAFGTWDQTNNGLHLGADHCGSEAWFPAAGLRHPDDGKLYGVGEAGYIWTRQSVGPDSVRQHYFLYNISGYSYARIYLSLPSARTSAQSVRCVRE